jgi:hypothetical protein
MKHLDTPGNLLESYRMSLPQRRLEANADAHIIIIEEQLMGSESWTVLFR